MLLLGSVEAVYRYGLARVGELPRPPPPRTGLAYQVLWLAEEGGPPRLEPLWPWRLVSHVPGVQWVRRAQRSAGEFLASMTAGRWLASRPRSERERPLHRTFQTLVLTVWISRHWSAEELLTAYAESARFGQGLIGLDAAARRYFGQEPERLALHEVALLAGLPQSPSRYDPLRRPEAALRRRDFVLSRLLSAGLISEAQREEARMQPLPVPAK
ncbi:Multimodular transpeptidase-transglycosylase [Cystobacter fuscus DSM 2262]|uniref:Multimodular transpeptidase-transglycosylase n=1 Tax=Cystobacter fuscus (strain ATCC 25194 / DSM 2262 / NBRC 100088 / M29) TaxID=1242864 RepID=S9R634_CYSF2|nr:Multimodular transpeptidase-transglycosylase [Cystobacter fuscus DSM 2262]